MSKIAQTYLKARDCDPKSSFGDFISVNAHVDISLANEIKKCVSDGIIAPSYSEDAITILKQKKKGNFIILRGLEPNYDLEEEVTEYREYKNCVLSQTSNNKIVTLENLNEVVTNNKTLSNNIKSDMILGLITLKYTQSNSVGFTYNGQMIGIGAGQQSRIDCVRLARMKAETWFLRKHPNSLDLRFKIGIKRQDKINATIAYIEDDFTQIEYNRWIKLFERVPEPLTKAEKEAFLKTIDGVVLSSDAFFPFRDSIDKASKIGVNYIVQPGGSIADASVIEACNEYNMVMVNTGIRLFHH